MLSDFAIVYEKSENNKLILVLIPIQHDVNLTRVSVQSTVG